MGEGVRLSSYLSKLPRITTRWRKPDPTAVFPPFRTFLGGAWPWQEEEDEGQEESNKPRDEFLPPRAPLSLTWGSLSTFPTFNAASPISPVVALQQQQQQQASKQVRACYVGCYSTGSGVGTVGQDVPNPYNQDSKVNQSISQSINLPPSLFFVRLSRHRQIRPYHPSFFFLFFFFSL